jgi:uncharacterized protein (TIGR02147 family)
VRFNRAKGFTQKDFYFNKLNSANPRAAASTGVRKLTHDQYEVLSTWRHFAVRSIIEMFPHLSVDCVPLAKMLHPPLRPNQVRQSIKLLTRLGLITPIKDGRYAVADKRITTGEQVQSLAALHFHLESIQLAEEALKELPEDKRNFSGLTVGISLESYTQIVEIIYECQKRIMDIADKDSSADRVYQVNFQAFPLSRV